MASWYGVGDYGRGNYSAATIVDFTGLSARVEFRASTNKLAPIPQLRASARDEYGATLGRPELNSLLKVTARNEYRATMYGGVRPVLRASAKSEFPASVYMEVRTIPRVNFTPEPAYLEIRSAVASRALFRFAGLAARSEFRGAVRATPWPQFRAAARIELQAASRQVGLFRPATAPARIEYAARTGPPGVGVALRGSIARLEARGAVLAKVRPQFRAAARVEYRASAELGRFQQYTASAVIELHGRVQVSYLWSGQTGAEGDWSGAPDNPGIWEPAPAAGENWASAPATADSWQNPPAAAENWRDVKNA